MFQLRVLGHFSPAGEAQELIVIVFRVTRAGFGGNSELSSSPAVFSVCKMLSWGQSQSLLEMG